MPRIAALRIAAPAVHSFSLVAEPDCLDVFLDGELFAREEFLSGARAVVLQEITRLAVPGRTWRAILHAGACWSKDAGCIILAGASFSGKSTLCAALIEAGWLCYSDDSACLTPSFEVAGMPFALALRAGERFRPSNLVGQSPVALASGLVFVDYQPGAEPIFDPLCPFEAFVELQRSGFWVEHTEAAIASFLRWLTAIPRHRLTYSVLADAVHLLGGL